MKQGKSLIELAAELERQKSAKKDLIADSRSLRITDGGKAVELAAQGTEAPLRYETNDTFRNQLSERLGIPRKYFDRMSAEAPALLDTNANHWLQADPKRRMVRTLDGRARALLSDRYQRVDNAEVAETVLPILIAAGAEIASAEITESRLYIKAVTTSIRREVMRGDVVQAGVIISNSEIGYGAVMVQPMVLRLVCSNGLIMQDERYRRHHVGSRAEVGDESYQFLRDDTIAADDRAILLKTRDVVTASLTEVMLEKFVTRAQEAAGAPQIEKPMAAIQVLAKARGLNDGEKEGVLAHLIRGGDLSRWGLTNAITALAREVDDYDRATELESMGGLVLATTGREWDTLRQAA